MVKKEIASYKETLQCLQAHYQFSEGKLNGLQNEFKGKESNKHH